jgi:heptosyltransferase-1
MAYHPFDPTILLVKTSSLGDVLHNMPVVSDIMRHYPNAQIDWLVEESFAALPRLHPAVRNVIPVAVRRWRKQLFSHATRKEFLALRQRLRQPHFDIAIDTQGLVKSALLTHWTHAVRCGPDWSSAREPLAALFYDRRCAVATGQHAVERNRQLAAQALGYTLETHADYGIRPPAIARPDWLAAGAYAVLLHATSRADKLWDEANWIALGKYLHDCNIRCVLPWGNAAEQARSQRLAAAIPDAFAPPRLDLDQAAALLGGAYAVIGVDTGLAHLAAALNVPTIGIYTATDPTLTGLYASARAVNLGNAGQAPDVAAVLDALQRVTAC